MIQRAEYINQLKSVQGKQVIKVLTGVRRCGKSTILELFQKSLIETGVQEAQIHCLNFEDLSFEHLQGYKALYDFLDRSLLPEKMNYIFLDEIQSVSQFERALDSLFIKSNVDLYITGSNAYMLSSELATLLSGRYIEIPVLPLSFREYFDYKMIDRQTALQQYLEAGGFPFAVQLDDERTYKGYIDGIISTVLIKDVLSRKKRSDAALVEQLAKFLVDSAGSLVTIKKIADTLTSMGQKTTSETVLSYLSAFLEAYLFYRCDRYDVMGKKYLSQNSKYYPVDQSFKKVLLGNKRTNAGGSLETVVFFELLRRGYDVFAGDVRDLEIDFVAIRTGITEYYQVSLTTAADATYQREVRSLKAVNDNYRKIVLTQDQGYYNDEGIEQINVIDWLLAEQV